MNAERRELPALGWAFLYFFLLLCSYYIVRPVRDEMGIQSGVRNLPTLFTATFLLMLAATPVFGWLAARYARQRLLPIVYAFFAADLCLFYLAFRGGAAPAFTAKAFFVWVSVFNMFVVSVFWSFMADVFSNAQAKRLFGVVAAGGSAGAIAGPFITAQSVAAVGIPNLLLVSAALLAATIFCIQRLSRWADAQDPQRTQAHGAPPIGGSVLAGIRLTLSSHYLGGIACYVLLLVLLGTFLYLQQQTIVAAQITDSAARTALFANIDFYVNIAVLLIELFVTARLMAGLGVAALLSLLPLLSLFGYMVLIVAPLLAVLIAFAATRRAVEYAIARPVREVLFTVVDREQKYKAKNLIDTVVVRGGDAGSAWLMSALQGLGAGLTHIALIALPASLAAAILGVALGRKQERLKRDANKT